MHRRGYLRIDDPTGRYEADVVVCSHCQRTVEVPAGQQAATGLAYCAACDALVCAACQAAGGPCVTFRARVEQQLEAAVRRRQLARALGVEA